MTLPGSRRSRLRSPLAHRLIGGVILFSISVTLLSTAVRLYGQYRYELKAIEDGLAQIEQVHLKALSQSLWATNQKELALQLDGMVEMPMLDYVAVHEGGRLWAESGKRAARNVIERHYPMQYRDRDATREIGMLTVVASLDAVYQKLLNQAAVILASNALTIFLVAGFILVFFHRLVNRHLLTVTGYVRAPDPGTASAPLALPRPPPRIPDEFDELTAAVNRLHEKTHTAVTALETGQQRFHAIADYTAGWENWIGPDGRLIWVNPSVQRLTGYTPDECLTMADFPLPIIASEDHGSARAEFVRAVRGGSGDDFEFRIRRKDGPQLWVSMSWQSIYGRNAEFLGYRSSVRDISERKRMELDLQDKVMALQQSEDIQKRLVAQAYQEQARWCRAIIWTCRAPITRPSTCRRNVNPKFRYIAWLTT